jgi:hypothetical protein
MGDDFSRPRREKAGPGSFQSQLISAWPKPFTAIAAIVLVASQGRHVDSTRKSTGSKLSSAVTLRVA